MVNTSEQRRLHVKRGSASREAGKYLVALLLLLVVSSGEAMADQERPPFDYTQITENGLRGVLCDVALPS